MAKFPAGSAINSLAASGADDAWAAESCRAPCASPHGALLRHWNGRTWQVAPPTPAAAQTGLATPGLAMTPGSPVAWGVYDEYDNQGRSSVIHWTGKGWAPQQLLAVNSCGPTDLWGCCYMSFARDIKASTNWLLRWNGKAWATVKIPVPLDSVGPLGGDGQGGVWFAGSPGQNLHEYLYHVSALGHWLQRPIPAPPGTSEGSITGFAPIPGTASMYAYGQVDLAKNAGTAGIILKYEP